MTPKLTELTVGSDSVRSALAHFVLFAVLVAVTTAPALAASGFAATSGDANTAAQPTTAETTYSTTLDGGAVGSPDDGSSDGGPLPANLAQGLAVENGAFTDVIATDDGGYLLVGWQGDSSTQHGWITKISEDGNTEWERTYGASEFTRFLSVEPADDGYVVAGTRVESGSADGWATKIDETGDVQWEETTGGEHADGFRAVVPAHDGGYLFAGYSRSAESGTVGWTVEFGEDGRTYSTETYSGTHGQSESYVSAAIRTDDGYMLAGSSQGSGWALSVDADGNERWNERYSNFRDDEFHDATAANDGGFVLTGETTTADSHVDGWTVKLDASGDRQWQETFGGDRDDWTLSVLQAEDGGYLLAGPTHSAGDASADGWVLKLRENGDSEWQTTYGGSWWDTFTTAEHAHEGGYVFAGRTSSYGLDTDAMLVRVQGPMTSQIDDAEIAESGVTVRFGGPVEEIVLDDGVEQKGVISLSELNVTDVTAASEAALPGEPVTAYDVAVPNHVQNESATATVSVDAGAIPEEYEDGEHLALAVRDGDGWAVANTSVVATSEESVTLQGELPHLDRLAVVALSEPTVAVEGDEVVAVGDAHELTADAAAPGEAEIVAYEWTVDGDSVDAAGAEAAFSFEDPGEHDVSLTVHDEHGQSARVNATVLANDRPSVAVDAPETPISGEQATFGASVDDEVGELTVSWQFDGETATGPEVSHTFEEPGEYEVTVVAEDEYGAQSTEQVTVEVSESDADPTEESRRNEIGLGIGLVLLVVALGAAAVRR